ncbi:hypothetical protein SFC50_25905 [Bacillus infantis]|uniref:hypothetical protein n=1 Tax=Bacillus infantis TaxID=324767 RepID=UPI003981A6ED
MKFADHLNAKEIRRFNEIRRFSGTLTIGEQLSPEIKPIRKPDAVLSRRDIEELMGTRRDTYKRVGGAVRRR